MPVDRSEVNVRCDERVNHADMVRLANDEWEEGLNQFEKGLFACPAAPCGHMALTCCSLDSRRGIGEAPLVTRRESSFKGLEMGGKEGRGMIPVLVFSSTFFNR